MRKAPARTIPEPFELTPKTRAWVQEKYPQVDIEATTERFECSARAHGWMYSDWQAGFKTVVRKGMENGWRSIVTIRGGMEYDPRWQSILHEARKFGFRDPEKHETPVSYRSQFELWKTAPKQNNVLDLRNVLKRVV